MRLARGFRQVSYKSHAELPRPATFSLTCVHYQNVVDINEGEYTFGRQSLLHDHSMLVLVISKISLDNGPVELDGNIRAYMAVFTTVASKSPLLEPRFTKRPTPNSGILAETECPNLAFGSQKLATGELMNMFKRWLYDARSMARPHASELLQWDEN